MSNIVPVKDRLRRAIERPLSADWPTNLHADALAYIEELELRAQVARDVLRVVRLMGAEQLAVAGKYAATIDLIMRSWPGDMSNKGAVT